MLWLCLPIVKASIHFTIEAAHRAYCRKDCNIRLTDEMIKEVVEVYCSLGPDPRSRKVKAVCTFEALCRITQTTKEDWERDFGQRLSSDLAEFSAGFFEGVNLEQGASLRHGASSLLVVANCSITTSVGFEWQVEHLALPEKI